MEQKKGLKGSEITLILLVIVLGALVFYYMVQYDLMVDKYNEVVDERDKCCPEPYVETWDTPIEVVEMEAISSSSFNFLYISLEE